MSLERGNNFERRVIAPDAMPKSEQEQARRIIQRALVDFMALGGKAPERMRDSNDQAAQKAAEALEAAFAKIAATLRDDLERHAR